MAFSEANKVAIRKYMGAGSIYKQLFPKLENAITAIQSTADGGSQVDSSTEDSVKAYLVKLAAVEDKLEALQCQMPVSYTHLRAHETPEHLVCRLLLEK